MRPLKRHEYVIVFQGTGVQKGWDDCVAAVRNAMVEAWEQLTLAPLEESQRQYQLRGSAATVNYQGVALPQWQYKISDGGRLLYLVDSAPVMKRGKQVHAGTVIVVEASPGHPKATERVKGSRKGPGRR
ncbi:MAG: hypothetical protein PHU75_10575 [Candidatus Nanopelagicales bacterium]|nr:hypothetical protein [Candidatus Nanopelagicales bacterium]